MTEIAGEGTGAAREWWGREASGARERQREGTASRKGKEHRTRDGQYIC